MKQLETIVQAFDSLCGEGQSAALATVVGVQGSSYRVPGARMLIAADGRTWGGVSGGCLERDVARRGRSVIDTGKPRLCRYDTSDEEQQEEGGSAAAPLGCRGIIDIFIEPLSVQSPGVLPVLGRVLRMRRPAALATVIASSDDQVGAHAWIESGGEVAGDIIASELHSALTSNLHAALNDARNRLVRHHLPHGQFQVFLEHVRPPQSIVVFGSGPDVTPVVAIAKAVGWHVTVVGSQSAVGLRDRFARADSLLLTSAQQPLDRVSIEPDAAVVLMTHNYPRDRRILNGLVDRPLAYLGILGPRQRSQRLLADLPRPRANWNVFAPIGLDLSAQTPEEIALAVVAEIQAVLKSVSGGSMRDRPGAIHAPPSAGASDVPRRTAPEVRSCPA